MNKKISNGIVMKTSFYEVFIVERLDIVWVIPPYVF